MRQPSRIVTATLCLVLLACFALAADFSQTKPAKDRITINVKDRPLGEILSDISQATGYAFILDESWRRYPVTAYLIDAPLHAGLKRILSGLNHAIVYLPDSRIKILIFNGASTGPASSGKQPVHPSIGSPPSRPPRPPGRAPTPASPGLTSRPPAGDSPESADPDSEETETEPEIPPRDENTQD